MGQEYGADLSTQPRHDIGDSALACQRRQVAADRVTRRAHPEQVADTSCRAAVQNENSSAATGVRQYTHGTGVEVGLGCCDGSDADWLTGSVIASPPCAVVLGAARDTRSG
jgi:hypothetical protein